YLAAESVTKPLSLHDALPISLPTIREMTNRCIWIQQGELIMDGDPTEVTKTYTGYTKRMAAKKYKSAEEYLTKVKSGLNTQQVLDRKSTRLNSSHVSNSYAVF